MVRVILAASSILATSLVIMSALVLFQPEWLFSTIRKRSPEVLYSVDIDKPVVALTIDDGPDPDETPQILDILEANGARATFFLITDRIPGNESIVARMIAEGHEVANHMTEDEPSILLSRDTFEQQLIKAHQTLSIFAKPRWFRPGSGWYNADMIAIAKTHGYLTALGSVYPYDPQLGSAWFSANYVLWKVKPGAIIVLHDYQIRGRRSAKALRKILPELNQRGFRVVTLSELVDLETKGEPPQASGE